MSRPTYRLIHRKVVTINFVVKGNSAVAIHDFTEEYKRQAVRLLNQHKRQVDFGVEVEHRDG